MQESLDVVDEMERAPCRKSCQKKVDKFAKKGKLQIDLKKACKKNACRGCRICGATKTATTTTSAPTSAPTPDPTPSPTPAPTQPQVATANWWSSFDRAGWSTTNGGFVAIFRNDCDRLYCIEEVKYAPFGLGNCYNANWWSSFDRKGWSQCNAGYYMASLKRNTCDLLYCIEEARCCQQGGRGSYPGGCNNASW